MQIIILVVVEEDLPTKIMDLVELIIQDGFQVVVVVTLMKQLMMVVDKEIRTHMD